MSKTNLSGEVARLMNAGLSMHQIATQLGRNVSQVRSYVDSLNIVLDGTRTLSTLSASAREKTAGHVRRLIEDIGLASITEQQYLRGLLQELEG